MFAPLENRQAREFIDTMQLHEAARETRQKLDLYRGTMAFRNTAGHDYLVKWHYEAGKRQAKVLGRRNAETEALERDFKSGRKRLESRLKTIEKNLAAQAKLNVAVGLGRLPDMAARILRAFERRGINHQQILVVGTNALYAYESLAGGIFDTQLVSTQDIDLFIDSRNALKLAVNEEPDEQILLNCLKAADRSFEGANRSYRATNRNGYMVDFIKSQRNPPWAEEGLALPDGDLQPSPIEGLIWLENAPVIVQPVLDAKGYPVTMSVPDPRVFAIHKYWLSQKPERGIKARRDRAQAIAVAMLVMNEFRHLPFDGRSLRMIPREIFVDAKLAFEKEYEKRADANNADFGSF